VPAAAGSRRPQRGDVQRTPGFTAGSRQATSQRDKRLKVQQACGLTCGEPQAMMGCMTYGACEPSCTSCRSATPRRKPAMMGCATRTVQVGQPPDGEHVAGRALARRALADQHGHRRPGAVLLAALEARPARLARSPGCAVLATPGRRCARARLGCVKSSAPATLEQAALTTGRPGQVRLVRQEPRRQHGAAPDVTELEEVEASKALRQEYGREHRISHLATRRVIGVSSARGVTRWQREAARWTGRTRRPENFSSAPPGSAAAARRPAWCAA